MQVRQVKFELREGTAAEWAAKNPTLRAGEPGYERDTNKLKVGDGNTPWNSLGYLTGAGSQGPPGDSAYEVAVANGFVGTESQWLLSLVGATGSTGPQGPQGDTGATGAAGPQGDGAYPLAGYGFVAASAPIETVKSDSTHGNSWGARVWVPAGTPINGLGVFVTQTGTTGSGNNAFAIYDDSGNLVGSTPTDDNLWVVAQRQWVIRNLSSPIAAQGSGRFVYAVSSRNGGTDPWIAYLNISFGEFMMSGGPTGKFRSLIPGGMSSSFPSTINVATPGSNFGYLPLYVFV